jgi:UDP-glucose 4-epimerase
MTSEPLIWIVGSGGLLGSHMDSAMRRHLPSARFWKSHLLHFSWTDPTRLAGELSQAAAQFAATVRAQGNAWIFLWCAGKGAMNSPRATLEPEWVAWNRLLDQLATLSNHSPGCIFLASSAGGVYGGSVSELLTEDTLPRPNSEYGTHKLRMEESLRDRTSSLSTCSYVIGRISSLYGPGQDLRKAQGVISHLSCCLIYRYPVSIYVPLDTRRDYLFVDDCADQIAAGLRRMMNERPQKVLKIFANEQSTSLAQIVGVFFRMAKHRPLIVSRQASGIQSISLRFRSNVWRDLGDVRKTDLAAGIHLLHEHQLALFQRGMLQRPS